MQLGPAVSHKAIKIDTWLTQAPGGNMVATVFAHKLHPSGTASASLHLLPLTQTCFPLLRGWQGKCPVLTAQFIFCVAFSGAIA